MAGTERSSSVSLRNVFANMYMRDAIFKVGVWQSLIMPGGDVYLQGMWDRCAANFPPEERHAPDGLEWLPPEEQGEWFVQVIRFPPPAESPEAWYGAIAFRPARRKWLIRIEPHQVRYLLLERTLELPGESAPSAMLGEWTLTAHTSFGLISSPSLEAFRAGVAELLTGRRAVTSAYVRPAQSPQDV